MAVIKNPHNLPPHILKNRANNTLDVFKSGGKDKAAIQALKAEGFADIEAEAQAHYKAYWDNTNPAHKEAIETRAALYEIINEES
jgi:hypothetical protein